MKASGKVWIFIRYNLIYSSDTQGTWHFKQFAKVWTFLNFPLYIERLKFSSFVILFTHCPNIFHQSYVVVKVKCSVMESNWSRPEHWFFSLTQGFTNILVSIFMPLCTIPAKSKMKTNIEKIPLSIYCGCVLIKHWLFQIYPLNATSIHQWQV